MKNKIRPSRYEFKSDTTAALMGMLAFVFLCGLFLKNVGVPALSLGLGNLAVFFGIAFVAVMLTCLGLMLLIGKEVWNIKIAALFAMALLIASAGVSEGILRIVDSRLSLGNSVAEAKIQYFCIKAFHPGQCADLVALCPQCTRSIPFSVRQEIANKLDLFLAELESDIKKNQEAAASGGPLTEAMDTWRKKRELASEKK